MNSALLLSVVVVFGLGVNNFPGDRGMGYQQAPHNQQDTTTLNGQWYLQPVLASDTATGKIPELIFNIASASFTGNTGCNNMKGEFIKTDTSFAFKQNIVLTKRFCTGYDETAFLRSLQRSNRYRLENGELILLFDATELSRWSRKPFKQEKTRKA